MSSGLLQVEANYHQQLTNLYVQEESQAMQQSKIRWLREGDANTAFFHASMRARRARNTIRNIEANDTLVTDQQNIIQLFIDQYRHLYNLQNHIRNIPADLFTPAITVSENQQLCTLASMDELRIVITNLNPNRALGAWFNGAFYRSSWTIIAIDLQAVVNNFLRSGKLLAQVNHTLLYLIPKKTIPATFDDYRPITLCNVIYRIISKLLANRLKPLLSKLIDYNQSAFINGRRITDSIHLTHELYHNLP